MTDTTAAPTPAPQPAFLVSFYTGERGHTHGWFLCPSCSHPTDVQIAAVRRRGWFKCSFCEAKLALPDVAYVQR